MGRAIFIWQVKEWNHQKDITSEQDEKRQRNRPPLSFVLWGSYEDEVLPRIYCFSLETRHPAAPSCHRNVSVDFSHLILSCLPACPTISLQCGHSSAPSILWFTLLMPAHDELWDEFGSPMNGIYSINS